MNKETKFARKRDLLVIRIADWRHDKYCKGIDIEVYRKGKYIRNESVTFESNFCKDPIKETQLLLNDIKVEKF